MWILMNRPTHAYIPALTAQRMSEICDRLRMSLTLILARLRKHATLQEATTTDSRKRRCLKGTSVAASAGAPTWADRPWNVLGTAVRIWSKPWPLRRQASRWTHAGRRRPRSHTRRRPRSLGIRPSAPLLRSADTGRNWLLRAKMYTRSGQRICGWRARYWLRCCGQTEKKTRVRIKSKSGHLKENHQ